MPKGVPKKTYPKVCPVCKKPFSARVPTQKFCSYKCVYKSKPKLHKQPKPDEYGVCLWCHGKFKKLRSVKQLFHTDKTICKQEFNRKKREIDTKYFFEKEKRDLEFERLKVLGENYLVNAEID
jgi:hypothetical protein